MNYINYSSFPTFNKALLYLTYLIWTKISNVKQFWEQFYKHIELASKFIKSRVRSLQTYLPLQMSIWSQFLSTFSSYRCFSRTIYNAISFELRKRLLFNYLSPIQLENKFNQIVDSFFFFFLFSFTFNEYIKVCNHLLSTYWLYLFMRQTIQLKQLRMI